MLPATADLVLSATGAQSIDASTVIQTLWSGYGEIVRLQLSGGTYSSVILKHIKLPEGDTHPRGWNTNLSHQRKIRSYQVEAYWYRHYAQQCSSECTVPACLAVSSQEDETILVLTDLDAAGYTVRKNSVVSEDIYACLDWLASFHATFLNSHGDGLWEVGSYWHLDTRPDELAALDDAALKQAAPLIDQQLRHSAYQTLVHGDAKLANFCFPPDNTGAELSSKVAAVDFQYVGPGCGMKDVAYFIGSCLHEDECERLEQQLLSYYFDALVDQIAQRKLSVDAEDLVVQWRALYPVAWADFHRFLKGWSPGHWKLNSYSERLTKQVIQSLSA